jgi:hypothetical protein
MKLSAIFVILLVPVHSTPINNGVNGSPEVACGENHIEISFQTSNTFEGHVFVKVCPRFAVICISFNNNFLWY